MPTTTTPGTIFRQINSEADDFVTVAQMTSATSGFALDTNVVHKTGVESIAGNKTFTGNIFVGNTAATSIEITSSNIQKIEAGISTTYNLPDYGGTLAIQEKCNLTNITYADLVSAKNNNNLIPGMQYRITDYVTKVHDYTGYSFFKSAEHQFDLIVVADSTNKLNEHARAVQHAGDDYFANSQLNKWKIKYCLDNDDSKYWWADTTSGKGVIYEMKDEWGNECYYDFKNVQFKRFDMNEAIIQDNHTLPEIFSESSYGIRYGFAIDLTVCFEFISGSDLIAAGYSSADSSYEYLYVTGTPDDGNIYVPNNDTAKWCYTFCTNNWSDATVNQPEYNKCAFNRLTTSQTHDLDLPYTVLFGSQYYGCYCNVFGDDCRSNTFDVNCYHNTFGDHCRCNTIHYCNDNKFMGNSYYNIINGDFAQNILGYDFSQNTFYESCNNNTFDINCNHNTFDGSCQNNTFGNYCEYNTFGGEFKSNILNNECKHNTFGNNCQFNTFFDLCCYNHFGTNCSYNTFGTNCHHNKFGDLNTIKNNYQYIIFENGVNNITLNRTSNAGKYQNVKLAQGLVNKTINDANHDQTTQTVYQPANSQIISI